MKKFTVGISLGDMYITHTIEADDVEKAIAFVWNKLTYLQENWFELDNVIYNKTFVRSISVREEGK